MITHGYENYHVQRWMRISEAPNGKPLDRNLGLVHVGRGMQKNGRNQFEPPDKFMSKKGKTSDGNLPFALFRHHSSWHDALYPSLSAFSGVFGSLMHKPWEC